MADIPPQVFQNSKEGDEEEDKMEDAGRGTKDQKIANADARERRRQKNLAGRDDSRVGVGQERGSRPQNEIKAAVGQQVSEMRPNVHLEKRRQTQQKKQPSDELKLESVGELTPKGNKEQHNKDSTHPRNKPSLVAHDDHDGRKPKFQTEAKKSLTKEILKVELQSKQNISDKERDMNQEQRNISAEDVDEGRGNIDSTEYRTLNSNKNDTQHSRNPEDVHQALTHGSLISVSPDVHTSARPTNALKVRQHLSQSLHLSASSSSPEQAGARPKDLSRPICHRPEKTEQQARGRFTGMFANDGAVAEENLSTGTEGTSVHHINLHVNYVCYVHDELEERKQPTKKHLCIQHCGSFDDLEKWKVVLNSEESLKEINTHFHQFGHVSLSFEETGVLEVGLACSTAHARRIGYTVLRYMLGIREKEQNPEETHSNCNCHNITEPIEKTLTEHDFVEEKQEMLHIMVKYQSHIEHDCRELNVRITIQPAVSMQTCMVCIQGKKKDVEIALMRVRSFGDTLGNIIVQLKEPILASFPYINVEEDIDFLLKTRNCVTEWKERGIFVHGKNPGDIKASIDLVQSNLVTQNSLLTGPSKSFKDNILKHVKEKAQDKVWVYDDGFRIHTIGLKSAVALCTKEIEDMINGCEQGIQCKDNLHKQDEVRKSRQKQALVNKLAVKQTLSFQYEFVHFIDKIKSQCAGVNVDFQEDHEKPQLIVILSGQAKDAFDSIDRLKKLVKDLQDREVSIATFIRHCLQNIDIGDDLNVILRQENLECCVCQQGNKVIVLGFDNDAIKRACVVVSRNIVKESYYLTGKYRDHAEKIKNILEDKGKGKVIVEVDKVYTLHIIGLADFVNSCFNELKSMLTSSALDFINTDNTSSPMQSIQKSEQTTQIENQAKLHLLTCLAGNTYISEIEKQFDVKVTLALKKIQSKGAPRKQGHSDNFHWIVRNKKKLVLECCRVEQTKADLKVLTRTHTENREQIGKLRKDGSNTFVDVGIRKFDKRNEKGSLSDLRNIFSTLLTQTDTKSIAMSLESFGMWEFPSFSRTITEICIDSLDELKKDEHPDVVVLCTDDKDHFHQAEHFIEEFFVQRTSVTKAVVVEGELDKTAADVIVNTTSHTLDLNTGRVSKALLRAAGVDLQKECHTQFPNGIENRGIALTRGHGLPCKHVIHVALSPFKQVHEQERLEDVRSVMQQCLARASELELKTIAIPAFGTGNLKYPPTLVAGEMFSSVERFAQDTKKTTLKKVMFVVFPRDTAVVQIYKRIESEFYEKRKSNPVHTLTVSGSSETAVDEAHRRLNVYLDKGNTGQKEEQVVMSLNEYAAMKKIFQGEFFAIDKIFVKCNYDTPNGILYIKGNPGDVNNAMRIVHQCHEKLNKMQKFCVPKQNRKEHLKDVGKLNGVYCVKDRFQGIVNIYAETEEIMSKVKSYLGKSDESPKAQKGHRSVLQNRSISLTTDAKNLKVFSMNKLTVKSYEADILLVPVDCIVNAANKDLQHGGGIAQVIASAAGSQMIGACRTIIQKAGKALEVGDVVETGGGNLRYRTVLHAVGPCWSDYDTTQESEVQRCVSDLRKTILNCLIKAEEQSVKSVAIPSISSGLFGVPLEICATTYVNVVHQYSKTPRTLEEIHFVDISHDMTKAIQDVLEEVNIKGQELTINTKCYQNTTTTKEVIKLTERGKTSSRKKLSFSLSEPAKFYLDDNIQIIVQTGDITMLQEVNAIVCSDSGHGKNVGIIARKLYERGGKDYQKEKNQKFETGRKVSDVVGTAGGCTYFKHVLHAVVPQKDLHLLKETYRNVFKEAKSLKVKSIAIPLLGTGQGDFSVKDSVTCLLSELEMFLIKNIKYGMTVHIVIYDDHTVAADVAELVQAFVMGQRNTNNPVDGAIEFSVQSDKVTGITRKLNEEKDTGARHKVMDTTNAMACERTNSNDPHTKISYRDAVAKPPIHIESKTNKSLCSAFIPKLFHFNNEVEINVHAEDITDLQGVTAIVCSVNPKGENASMIARKLHSIGGNVYRDDKNRKFKKKEKNVGDIITTIGGDLGYERVLHAVVPHADEQHLHETYKNIFLKAQKLKVDSLAFPLLGTGGGAYTVDTSLTALLTQLEQFCKQKNKYLKAIHIVIKEQTMATYLAEQVQSYIDNKAVNEPSKDANLNARGTRKEPEKLEEKQPQPKGDDNVTEDCVICMDKMTSPKTLRCGHRYCRECIEDYFKIKLACPTCGMVCGVISGDQPSGTMDIQKQLTHLAGYNDCGSISVGYRFPDGHQGANHPRPGSFYAGINRVAYLPDNDEGRRVCGMLAVAFQRRLVFTIGTSRTTGQEGVITWNDIHHKTDHRPNTQFGYPDPTYLKRVAEELAIKGVTVSDITPDMAKFLKDKTPGARKQISTK